MILCECMLCTHRLNLVILYIAARVEIPFSIAFTFQVYPFYGPTVDALSLQRTKTYETTQYCVRRDNATKFAVFV